MAAQFASNKDRLTRLFMAIGLLMASQSEMLCYLLMILDQMVYGSLLSLPLPLMVFLWGMLSVPRPSKTFWVTVITYIEVSVEYHHLALICSTCFSTLSYCTSVILCHLCFVFLNNLISYMKIFLALCIIIYFIEEFVFVFFFQLRT